MINQEEKRCRGGEVETEEEEEGSKEERMVDMDLEALSVEDDDKKEMGGVT